MKDRVPLYPGRVTLTPVSGQANTYDLTRADQPTQEGTPLNKANLLKDATAALYGLGADAVPDDVLAQLWRFPSNLGNEYLWEKYLVEKSLAKQETALIVISKNTPGEFYYGWGTYGKSASINNEGKIVIGETFTPTTAPYEGTSNYWRDLLPFYCTPSQGTYAGAVFYFTSITSAGSEGIQFSGQRCVVNIEKQFKGYVNSDDFDAYPPVPPDEYTYKSLGQLGDKVHIATGSYTGTGTYGSSHPNSLTFGFVPKLVIISAESLTIGYGNTLTQPDWKLWIGQPNAYVGYNKGNVKDTYKVEGNKFSWYNSNYGSATMQLNYSGQTYYYIAIG